MLAIRKILHPTDYSDQARPAFDLACALARDFGAELVICHVLPPSIIAAGEGLVVDCPTDEAEQLAARLKRVQPTDPRVRVTHELLRGDPAREILRLADDAETDLIVMGTHGRSGIARLLVGSVAEAVMRKAPCPVVTVKAPGPTVAETRPAADCQSCVAGVARPEGVLCEEVTSECAGCDGE